MWWKLTYFDSNWKIIAKKPFNQKTEKWQNILREFSEDPLWILLDKLHTSQPKVFVRMLRTSLHIAIISQDLIQISCYVSQELLKTNDLFHQRDFWCFSKKNEIPINFLFSIKLMYLTWNISLKFYNTLMFKKKYFLNILK